MTFEEMQKILTEYCGTVSYDHTGDWRLDPRTAEDPDDTDETVTPVKPSLTVAPKVIRGRK